MEMNDKMPAEIDVWIDKWGDHRWWSSSSADTTRYIRADIDAAKRKELADRLDDWYSQQYGTYGEIVEDVIKYLRGQS